RRGYSFSVSGQTRFRLWRPLGSALRSGAIPLLRSPLRFLVVTLRRLRDGDIASPSPGRPDSASGVP
ncbi:MAG: hypothetical protein AB7E30_05400, partial [Lawsonibacter sp.]